VKTVIANWLVKCDHRPSRVPGVPHVERRVAATARTRIGSCGVPPERRVLEQKEQADGEDDSDSGGEKEGRRPAEAVQGSRQREGGADGAQLSELTRELGQQRCLADAEPQGHDPDDADEHHRVPAADENAGRKPDGERPGEGEPELAGRHEEQTGDQQPARAEPVEQHPDGDLHGGVDQQLDHGEGGQLGGRDVEALRGDETGDAQ